MKILKPICLILLAISFFNSFSQNNVRTTKRTIELNNQASNLISKGKYENAIQILNMVIQMDSTQATYFHNLGFAYSELDKLMPALKSYKKAISLDNSDETVFYKAGNICRKLQKHEAAVTYYDQAILLAKQTNSSRIHSYFFNKGNTLLSIEKYAEAEEAYNQTIQYNPNQLGVFNNRGICRFYQDKIHEACVDWYVAISRGQKQAEEYFKKNCKSEEKELIIIEAKQLIQQLKFQTPNFKPNTNFTAKPFINQSLQIKESTVYFNELWEICKKEDASYFRKCKWQPTIQFFVGDFTDYDISENKLLTSSYLNGYLNGKTEGFHQNGKLKYSGTFKNGLPVETWTEYHPSGQIKLRAICSENGFEITHLNDSAGQAKLEDLTGKWEYIITGLKGDIINIKGKINSGKKDKMWTIKINGKLYLSETYSKGEFKGGKMTKGNRTYYTNTPGITSWIFSPTYLEKTKKDTVSLSV